MACIVLDYKAEVQKRKIHYACQVFTQPVNEEEVPGYSSIIKNPMDFQKMMQKLVDQEYKQITDLKVF